MSMRRTPPLSVEGSREVIEEMKRPPPDTPERRATLERARALRPLVQTPDATELIREMERPPADTPQRRAMFRRADAMHRFVEKLMLLRGAADSTP